MTAIALARIELARGEDLPALPGIERAAGALFAGMALPLQVLATETSPDDFAHAARAGHLWVARADGAIAGFALVELIDGEPHLEEMDVHPEHGRKGIGRRLLGAVQQWGATASFESPTAVAVPRGPSTLDALSVLDDTWPVGVALVGIVIGVTALVGVVYASPALFAEVLLDAAVVGAVYRRARRRNRAHWLKGVVRRTWLPAAVLCVTIALAGFALQVAAPEARSLGDVLR